MADTMTSQNIDLSFWDTCIWTDICPSSQATVFDIRGDKISTVNTVVRKSFIKTDSLLSSQKIYRVSWQNLLVQKKKETNYTVIPKMSNLCASFIV
jgi:hypothetical protein